MLTFNFPDGTSVLITSTGKRFMADAVGQGVVQEFTQDHYDLLNHGCEVVADSTEADRLAVAAEEEEQRAAEQVLARTALEDRIKSLTVQVAGETDDAKKAEAVAELEAAQADLAALGS